MASARQDSFGIQFLQLVDAGLVWLSFLVALAIREPLLDLLNIPLGWFGIGIFKQGLEGLRPISWLLFIVIPFTPLCLELFGFYRHPLRQRMGKALWQVTRAFVVLALGVGCLAYFLRLDLSSRAVIMMAAILAAGFLLARTWVSILLWQSRAASEQAKECVVLAGTNEDIDVWLSGLPSEATAYWRVVGRHDLSSDDWEGFQKLLHDEAVERVIFAARHTEFARLANAIEMCEVRGVEAWVAAGFMQTQVARPTFDQVGGKPMLVLRSTPELSWELMIKGFVDRIAAAVLIAASSPLWLIAYVGIKRSDPGPVFFRQERGGRYGKMFRMWKFRTMCVDAEAKLAAVKAEVGNEMSGPVFKLEDDPRVFKFGKWLRKTSIDELPQLLNVLSGDMSLVGPRPLPMYEVRQIENSAHRRRMSVKPGITCIWQVEGRNTITDFNDWVKLDLQYIDHWSLWLDFKLLLKTIPSVLFSKGAK